ncbi:MAG: ribbon-helix-helix domain-containing protein [Promethearchaeia archaeon]
MTKKKKKPPMKNISISLPSIYLKNIQKLIDMNLMPNRSEAVRTAIREFLQEEYENLDLLGFFNENKDFHD